MKAEVRVLCSPGAAAGFGLLGLAPEPAADPLLAAEAMESWLQRGRPAVLLVEERLLDRLPPELRVRAERSTQPLVVPFPGPSWVAAEEAEARVVALLRRAIGYRVRL